jgi:hypothetical protein
MSKQKVANHLHKYKKVDLARDGEPYLVYKCMKPACSHYVPLHLAEGKLCECNRCGEPMIITKATLHGSSNKPMAKPHCPNCIERKKEKLEDVAAISEFLAGTKT